MTTLPVPRLQLMQVGQWRAPRWDFSTKLTVEVKEAITDMYRGASFDFDVDHRADLQPIRVTHEAAYHCCGDKRSCTWAMSEWDGIVRSLGVRTKILFYRYPNCLDCPTGCVCNTLYDGAPCYHCITKGVCGQWLWQWGTVTKITNDLTADDFKTIKTATTSFEVRLEGPLQTATHRDWLVSSKLQVTKPCQTLEDAAALVQYEKRLFHPPCGPGDCCARERFWPRSLDFFGCLDCEQDLDCLTQFEPLFWDTQYSWKIQHGACFNLYVPGHATPKVRAILSSGLSSVEVKNAVGTAFYTYATAGPIYSDTSTGLVWNNPGTGYVLLPGALSILALEPGENVITATNTSVTIGVLPYWVN